MCWPDKYIDLVGMNTANGAQAQIWNYVSGGNQEWNLVRVDADAAQTYARPEEKPDPEPTPSQRKHQNDLVRKLNNAGKGRAGRKGDEIRSERSVPQGLPAGRFCDESKGGPR